MFKYYYHTLSQFGIYPIRQIPNLITLVSIRVVGVMNAKEAVAKRIQALCADRDIAINALATTCGIPPSTVYSMLNQKSKNPGVISIQKICDGLGISVREFFNDPLFDHLDAIIK